MPGLPSFIANTYIPTVQQARLLRSKEDDDSQPYKSKYEAADVLKDLETQAATAAAAAADKDAAAGLGINPGANEQLDQQQPFSPALLTECLARCKLERGLVLLDTDLISEGQKALEDGLAHAWPDNIESLAIQQQAHNALASLWCERSEYETALKHLQAAVDLHAKLQQLMQREQQQQISPDGARILASGSSSSQQPQHEQHEQLAGETTSSALGISCWQSTLFDAPQVDREYTTTLFYMAQVYSHMGDKQRSASYCAATLNRQLQEGVFDLNDWVQNCLQLSGYFLDCNAFALSQYCCAAVHALLLQQHQKQQGRQAKVEAQGQQQQCNCCEDQLEGKDQTDKQPQQQQQPPSSKASTADPIQQQQPDASSDGAQSCPSAALQDALLLLEDDVAANVCLAFAKRDLYCLVASHEVFIEGKQPAFSFSSPSDVPSVMSFDALSGLPDLSGMPWGRKALASSYEGALDLFKAALPWFRKALEHYQLDGWVTEHCNILFEMSNMYRCLAGFEDDPHKRCVMHRNRAKLLQPLEGELSHTHYPGLARSISLELGNIFREIADIKSTAGREPDKVAVAMQSAAKHYQLFINSFKGSEGELPDRVEPEMEQHFLSGMFSLARMLQGLPGTGTLTTSRNEASNSDKHRQEVANLEQAVSVLQAFVKYVGGNQVSAWQEQADMAEELSELLQEKLALMTQLSE